MDLALVRPPASSARRHERGRRGDGGAVLGDGGPEGARAVGETRCCERGGGGERMRRGGVGWKRPAPSAEAWHAYLTLNDIFLLYF